MLKYTPLWLYLIILTWAIIEIACHAMYMLFVYDMQTVHSKLILYSSKYIISGNKWLLTF